MPTHRPRCVVAVFGPGSRFLLAEGKCARPEITGGPCPSLVICGNVTENPKEEPGRFAIVNHFNRTVAALAPTSNFPGLKAFLPQNLWAWISNYLKNAFTPRYPFPDYTKSGKTGVYSLSPAAGGDTITIAIAGDWGTGTQEAETIADLMIATKPDLTIHLGDVYYVGDAPEIQENCFGMPTNGFQGVKWPHGSQGSFSLNGNHEMYANGRPYFTTFLPTLGMQGDASGQLASFFCLETAQWRIVAIDTAYNSVGIPILSQIPVINSIPFIGGDCHLEEALLTWLRTVVKPKANPKATLLFSHHQYFTAFKDHAYTKPAKQLMEFFQGQDQLLYTAKKAIKAEDHNHVEGSTPGVSHKRIQTRPAFLGPTSITSLSI